METSQLDVELRLRIHEFYARETMLLDDGRLDEWLRLLAPDVRYTMPFPESSTHPRACHEFCVSPRWDYYELY
ncbi:hypothetical protein M1248_30955, partial [Mycobacterium sp. 29Ha]|nr:hypothetical protein [Mycobacterium sp. 29Ha]